MYEKMAASLGTLCARRPGLAAPVAGQGNAKPLAFVFTEKTSLRTGPESSFVRTELSSHEADGGETEERQAIAGEIFEILGQAAAAVEPSRCNGVSTGNADSRQKPLYRHRARDDTELVLDLLSLSKDGDHRGYPAGIHSANANFNCKGFSLSPCRKPTTGSCRRASTDIQTMASRSNHSSPHAGSAPAIRLRSTGPHQEHGR
jgi:hypothetical protein